MRLIIMSLVIFMPGMAMASFFEPAKRCETIQVCERGHCRMVTVCR